jgi:heme-degrading monooxygenase HmoA
MFASVRRYRLRAGSMDTLARLVDEGFAPEISAQPGFLSYEFLECGYGEVMTISVFREAEQARASRKLAERWSDENLRDFTFSRTGALAGQIAVSRATEQMLEPTRAGAARRYASVRRFKVHAGSVAELMRAVDRTFAGRVEALDGFIAYHAMDCGGDDVLSISLFRDLDAAEESAQASKQFVAEDLGAFDLERIEITGGEVVVSRAQADVLEPAHA